MQVRTLATLLVLLLVSCVQAPQEFSYQAPDAWKQVQPSNPMRVDEYLIDSQSQTSLNVFFFPGMHDAQEANLQRWLKQFSQDDMQVVSKENLGTKNLKIQKIIIEGTFLQSSNMMDPNAAKQAKPKQRMQAYIIETPRGTWFFKATGPKAVLESKEKDFHKLQASFKMS